MTAKNSEFLCEFNTKKTDDYHDYFYEQFELNESVFKLNKDMQDEIRQIQKINYFLKQGNEYFNYLYSARNLSSCLNQLKGTESTEEKEKICLKNFKLLLPYMDKLSLLNSFSIKLVDFIVTDFLAPYIGESFKEAVKFKNQNLKQTLNVFLLDKFVKLIDILVKLDLLKDMKASLLNDFSSFKRNFQLCKGILSPEDLQKTDEETYFFEELLKKEVNMNLETIIGKEIYKLQIFLCDPSGPRLKILSFLKNKLYNEGGNYTKSTEQVNLINKFLLSTLFALVASLPATDVDKRQPLLPEDNFSTVRVIAVLILLLDSNKFYNYYERIEVEEKEKEKTRDLTVYNLIFKNKDIINIMIKYSKIPLQYDISFNLIDLLKACPSYSLEKDLVSTNTLFCKLQQKTEQSKSNFGNKSMTENFNEFIKKFNRFLINVENSGNGADSGGGGGSRKIYNSEYVFKCTKLCLEGFKLLSKSKESHFMKYSNTTPEDLLKNKEFVDSILLNKTLIRLLLKNKKYLEICLKSFIYNEVRKFPINVLDKLISTVQQKQIISLGNDKKSMLSRTLTRTLYRNKDKHKVKESKERELLNHLIEFREYFSKFIKTKKISYCDLISLSILSEKLLLIGIDNSSSYSYGNNKSKSMTGKYKTLTTSKKSTKKYMLSKEEINNVDKFISRLTLFTHFNKFDSYLFNLSDYSFLYFNEFTLSLESSLNKSKQIDDEKQVIDGYFINLLIKKVYNNLNVNHIYLLDIFNDSYYNISYNIKNDILLKELSIIQKIVYKSLVKQLSTVVFDYFKYQAANETLHHLTALYRSTGGTCGTGGGTGTGVSGVKKLLDSAADNRWVYKDGYWNEREINIKYLIIKILDIDTLTVSEECHTLRTDIITSMKNLISDNIYLLLNRLNKYGLFGLEVIDKEMKILINSVNTLQGYTSINLDVDKEINRMTKEYEVLHRRCSTEIVNRVYRYYSFNQKERIFKNEREESKQISFHEELIGSVQTSKALDKLLLSRQTEQSEVSVLSTDIFDILSTDERLLNKERFVEETTTFVINCLNEIHSLVITESCLSSLDFENIRLSLNRMSFINVMQYSIKKYLESNSTEYKIVYNVLKLLERLGNSLYIVYILCRDNIYLFNKYLDNISTHLVTLHSSASVDQRDSQFILELEKIVNLHFYVNMLNVNIELTSNEFENDSDKDKKLTSFGDSVVYGYKMILRIYDKKSTVSMRYFNTLSDCMTLFDDKDTKVVDVDSVEDKYREYKTVEERIDKILNYKKLRYKVIKRHAVYDKETIKQVINKERERQRVNDENKYNENDMDLEDTMLTDYSQFEENDYCV